MFAKINQLGSPKYFDRIAAKSIPWFGAIALILFLVGIVTGLGFAPPDYQQGDAFRIIYIHVPSAVISLFIYVLMTSWVIIYLVWKIKITDILAKNSAILGASFTFLALVTGSIWGKPMWGTWWIWDARLTSELILLFIYMAIIVLRNAIPDQQIGAKAAGILTLVGLVDIPIIHYSVYWWNTLHQPPTLFKLAKPTIAPDMLYPLLIMLGAFLFYFITVLLMYTRLEILQQNKLKKLYVKMGSLK